MYHDRQGNPISLFHWAALMETPGYQHVAEDYVGFDRISTVWLGINHNFIGEGPPIIFETMIFWFEPPEDDAYMEDMWRYPTEAAALAGHDQAVAYVRSLCHKW